MIRVLRGRPERLKSRRLPLTLFALAGITAFIHGGWESKAQKVGGGLPPTIPKTWDDEALASLEVPLADAGASPVHISSEYYYRIPVRQIYKSYPVYAPGKEPAGYWAWLQQQEPVMVFDASKIKTEADWIRAGEIVFDAPTDYDADITVSEVKNPAWYEATGVPLAKDGTMPFTRYAIRKRGQVELGNFSCAMCHTRVRPDGTSIQGAQGNFPLDRALAFFFRARAAEAKDEKRFLERVRLGLRFLFAAPWLQPDPLGRLEQMSIQEIASAHQAIPPGVLARRGTSPFYPVQVPDLIGVNDRRYLDHTGLVLHRTIGDLMRYAALNQGGDDLNRFGDFRPLEALVGKLPDPAAQTRYSDEQLYALALYIYSLKPPPNLNQPGALARRGQKIFEREGCGRCHTPPLYTNNQLTPVDGFRVPADHFKKYDVLSISVGTDPNLALKTRRGTGCYKVPSLKGVWYRGPFEHSGSVATLEDWFDPRRTSEGYIPTGFRGFGVRTRAVKGHTFGLDLPVEDRKALIAFLKTL